MLCLTRKGLFPEKLRGVRNRPSSRVSPAKVAKLLEKLPIFRVVRFASHSPDASPRIGFDRPDVVTVGVVQCLAMLFDAVARETFERTRVRW